MNITLGIKCRPRHSRIYFCPHPKVHIMILLRWLLSSDNIPTADYYTQDNLLDFQKVSLEFRDFTSFHLWGVLQGGAVGGDGGGLKSNEKDALSSQKTLNKQDEVIGTAACAPPVMMAPLIGLQLTQLQAAPLNFHCSHFPSQCATHFHCFIICIPHMLRICTRTYNIFWLAY